MFGEWLSSILKNASGEFEVGRSMLVASGASAITTPVALTLTDMAHNGWHFDPTAFCLAYGGMLTAINGVGVYTIGKKGRDDAIARQTVAQAPLSDTETK